MSLHNWTPLEPEVEPSSGGCALTSAMLGLVAEAVCGGTTQTSIARLAADALRAHLPLLHLELGWCDADLGQADVICVDCAPQGLQHQHRRASLAQSAALRAVTQRQMRLWRCDREAPRHPEALRAQQLGAPWVLVLPLLFEDAEQGFALLYLRQAPGGDPRLTRAPLVALARILQGAWRNTQVLHRVAQVSRNAHRENQKLRRQLQASAHDREMVAGASSMRQLLAQVDLVAEHDTTVLLLGESGTGKELIARRLHQRSPRRAEAFIQVNCGALPQSLIESELFGHERGAFTGASRRHRGLFERAHGGTILLDEVADLPAQAQVKLLRVLQEGVLERVGGESPINIDVRVVAATHKPLTSLVEQGHFREDLFYRLHVFPVHLPPLRHRREDLPELSYRLMGRIAGRMGRQAPSLAPEALDRLLGYHWPGNVRELENVLERALVLTPGPVLRTCALPPTLQPQRPQTKTPPEPEAPQRRFLSFEEAARRHISQALRLCQGRVYGDQGAAQLLGLKPTTLQSRMKRLGLDRQDFTDAL